MKRLLVLVAAFTCFSLSTSYVHADDGERNFFDSMYCFFFSCSSDQDHQARDDAWNNYTNSREVRSVPELDGAGAPVAAALIAGVIGLGIERRRRKAKVKAKA